MKKHIQQLSTKQLHPTVHVLELTNDELFLVRALCNNELHELRNDQRSGTQWGPSVHRHFAALTQLYKKLCTVRSG